VSLFSGKEGPSDEESGDHHHHHKGRREGQEEQQQQQQEEEEEQEQERWYLFNDSLVQKSSYRAFSAISQKFSSDVPYLLFYARATPLGPRPDSTAAAAATTTTEVLPALAREVEADNARFLAEEEAAARRAAQIKKNRYAYARTSSPFYRYAVALHTHICTCTYIHSLHTTHTTNTKLIGVNAWSLSLKITHARTHARAAFSQIRRGRRGRVGRAWLWREAL
jgi:hypothetical protein